MSASVSGQDWSAWATGTSVAGDAVAWVIATSVAVSCGACVMGTSVERGAGGWVAAMSVAGDAEQAESKIEMASRNAGRWVDF